MRNRRRKPKTSKECHIHFKKRIRERYDILLTDKDILNIEKTIRSGAIPKKRIFKESNTRTHFRLEIKNQMVRIVYERKVGAVTTALPLEDL